MADPPLPYDALTLSIECAKLGGIENCAFRLPAGAKLHSVNSMFSKGSVRTQWLHAAHVRVTDNMGIDRFGEEAVLAIASQQLSIQCVAQITGIALARKRACDCASCVLFRQTHELAKLIGLHPDPDPE